MVNNPKRKLLLASFTAPPNQDGVAMVVGCMAREMERRGWEVFIAAPEPDSPTSNDLAHFYALPRNFGKGAGHKNQQIVRELLAWLDTIEPSAIVIHSWLGWPIYHLMPYARSRKIPIFLMGHGFGMHLMQWTATPPFFGLARWLRSWGFVARMCIWLRQMEGLVVLGKKPHYIRAFDHWLAHHLRCRKTHSIPNAIQPLVEGGIDFRNKWNLGSKLIVLCVAGYSPRKDQLLVLKGFLDAKIPNSVMVFIGPTMSNYGLRLVGAAQSHKDSVLILHDIPRSEVEAAVKNCDVAILGSQSEMQPIFLLEAMSEAKPWICPLVGAVDELKGGIICKRTPTGLSAALSSLEAHDQRTLLGAQGKAQWQSDFTTEVVFDKWHGILNRAVAPDDTRNS